MRKISYFVTYIVLAIGLLTTVLVGAASAQTTGAGSGIKISPVRTDLVVSPGASSQVIMEVQNVSGAGATFQAVVNDFIAGNNEEGQPALILNDNQYAPSHSLKRFVDPIPSVYIGAGQTKEVDVTVSVPKDAAGGGYYGAVRFIPENGSSGNGSVRVSLSASVGSLILIKVPGNIVDNMNLVSFDVRNSKAALSANAFYLSNKNLYAVVRFQNNGNVQEEPFGKIILKRGNKVLQSSEINAEQPPSNVIPDSIRRFSVKLDKVGVWGRYTIGGNFGYGSKGQLLTSSSSFIVFPLAYIIGILVIILMLFLLIFVLPKTIKRYNAAVVHRASRGRR